MRATNAISLKQTARKCKSQFFFFPFNLNSSHSLGTIIRHYRYVVREVGSVHKISNGYKRFGVEINTIMILMCIYQL